MTGPWDPGVATPGAGTGPGGYRFAAGDVLSGRYKVLQSLARGGMGEVYEVEDTHLREVVALKTLNATLAADALARTRFQGEVKSARRVSHPNVCRIFDFGVHGEGESATYFLTMELLTGETLETRLRRGRPSSKELLEVMQQVAAAIDAAHEMGVVHRDLKPSNVMLVQFSGGGTRAVVTDFGIARRLNEATVTKEGWVGTPAYISPEQLEGKKVDAAADVYSLGVMLFEVVTGKLPFEGSSSVEVAMQRLARVAPRAREVDAAIPPAWDEAIARCLAREPGERWVKATDALQAMGAEAPGAWRPARRTSRRGVFGLGALLVVLAAGAVAWWQTRAVLPATERVVSVQVDMAPGALAQVMPQGFPSFNSAVSYVVQKQWREMETARRFRISKDATGNVLARLEWKPDGKEVVGALELGAQGRVVRRVEGRAGNLQALAKQLYPVLAEVVGAQQVGVELWPEEREEAALINAPSADAYKAFMAVFRATFERISSDDEQLMAAVERLDSEHPSWAHAVALHAEQLGIASAEARALARHHLELPGIERDASGAELLRRIAAGTGRPSLNDPDWLGAMLLLDTGGLSAEESIAVHAAWGERKPEFQHTVAALADALARRDPRRVAEPLRKWMQAAPGQQEAWLSLTRLGVLEHTPVPPMELLFEPDTSLQVALCFIWVLDGKLELVTAAAVRVGAASPRYRAISIYLLAIVDICRGGCARRSSA